jgi:NAD(P)H-flavin reductase
MLYLVESKVNSELCYEQQTQELEFDKFYLCGPETMIEVVTGVLKEKT